MAVKGLSDVQFILGFQAQRHWDWRVAFYLYGAGTSAGLIFLEVLLRALGLIDARTALYGMWIGLGLALLSLAFLFDHLGPGSRWRFLYVFTSPRTSWIARGAIIVTGLVLLRIALLLPSVPRFETLPVGEGSAGGNVLRAAVLLFAAAFMAYSGLVLSSWNSIEFWNTPMLPMLYIGYSFLGGMALLPVIALVSGGKERLEALGHLLWPYLLALLLVNGFALLIYLWGMSTGSLPARESVRRLVKGDYRWSFWLGVVALGLFFPILGTSLALAQPPASSLTLAMLVGLCVGIQLGGYLLRDNILRVGIYGEPI